jgi:hypothetical protein
MDKLASTKITKQRENNHGEQWVDETTNKEKSEMRHKERVWKRTRTRDTWNDFAKQRKYINTAICLHV